MSLRKRKRHTRTFDCNRTTTADTKRVCQIKRRHQMHTPTRVLIGIHHSNERSESIRVLVLVLYGTSLRKRKGHTRTFDCNITTTVDTKRVCRITRQHQMQTPTRVLIGFHPSNDPSLSDYSYWYPYRQVYVLESDILERVTAIEPQQY
jgi:hypothetical protein